MMLLLIMLLIPLGIERIKCDKDISPVFLIDYSDTLDDVNIDANPFHKTSTAIFADIVHTAIKRGEVIIVFVEDQFATEDISTADALGTPYRNLREGLLDGKVRYLPKVIEPYRLLKQVFQPHQFNVFHVGSDMDLQMLNQKFKHLYIFFRKENKDETRVEMLRRHDLIMREVYTVMSKLVQGPVLAFYTGKLNPVQVDNLEFVPIAPVPDAVDAGVMVVTDGALFRFSGVYAATQTRRAMFNQAPIVAEETWTDKTLSTKMAYTDFDLEFNFLLRTSDWLLDSVTLYEGGEEVGRTATAVAAPWYHSYYCGEPLVVINKRDGSSVTISEYQIQAMRQRRDKCRQKRRRTAKESHTKNNGNKAIGISRKMISHPERRQGSMRGYYYDDYFEAIEGIDYAMYAEIHEVVTFHPGSPLRLVKFHLKDHAKKIIEANWEHIRKTRPHILDYYNKDEISTDTKNFEHNLIDYLKDLRPTTTTSTTRDPNYVDLYPNATISKLVRENMAYVEKYASYSVKEMLRGYVYQAHKMTPWRIHKSYLEGVPAFLEKLMSEFSIEPNASIAQIVTDNHDEISSNKKFKDLLWFVQEGALPRKVNTFKNDEINKLLSQFTARPTTSTTTTPTTTTDPNLVVLFRNESLSKLANNNWDEISRHADKDLKNILVLYASPDRLPQQVSRSHLKNIDSFLKKLKHEFSIDPNASIAQIVTDNYDTISSDPKLKDLLWFVQKDALPRKVNSFKKDEIDKFLSQFTARPSTTSSHTTTADSNLVILYQNDSLSKLANNNWDVISKHADTDLKNILVLYASPDRHLPKQVSRSHLKNIDSFLEKLKLEFSIHPNASIAQLVTDNYDTISSEPELKDLLWFVQKGALPRKVNAFKKQEIGQLLSRFTTRPGGIGLGCTAVQDWPGIGLGCTAVDDDNPGGDGESASSDAPADGGDGQDAAGEEGADGEEGAGDECGGFGTTVNCTPYFSAGILSALFLVWLWLIALAIGFSALYDCQTNNRYDDPHGKMPDTTER